MIGKIRDTLIGLWPVVKTYVPATAMIIAVVVAFLVGLVWGYGVDPKILYDGDPSQLGQGWQDEWVLLLADRYDKVAANAIPTDEFNQSIVQRLANVDHPLEIVNRLGLTQLNELAAQAEQIAPQTAPQAPSLIANIRPWILGPIIVALVFIIGSLLYGFYINPMVVEPIRKRIRGSQGTDAQGAVKIQEIKAARAMVEQLNKDAATAPASDLGPPVARHVSIYSPSRAYDDSFSIEDAAKDDEFLGECGAVISETIGAGEPEKVTAIEIWLFDKEDFVRTLTTVFVSEHAANDPAIRSKLEPKGELVVARPGAIAKLETNTLRLQARIVDISYGSGPLPPNSYFDKMTIELQAWRKAPSAVGAVSAAPAMVTPMAAPAQFAPAPVQTYAPPPAAPTYTPPAVQSVPSPFAPPSSPPAQAMPPSFGVNSAPLRPAPLQPPPSSPPPLRQEDDDPFGGTGDFTPVN